MKTSQLYHTLHEFALLHKLVLPKPREDWRLVMDPPTGAIQGVHTIAGRAVATNGILYAIERGDGQIFFGHVEFFIPDVDVKPPPTTKTTKTARQRVYAEYE